MIVCNMSSLIFRMKSKHIFSSNKYHATKTEITDFCFTTLSLFMFYIELVVSFSAWFWTMTRNVCWQCSTASDPASAATWNQFTWWKMDSQARQIWLVDNEDEWLSTFRVSSSIFQLPVDLRLLSILPCISMATGDLRVGIECWSDIIAEKYWEWEL